jgi:hypothetical protein
MCGTPANFMFHLLNNQTPAWFTPPMAEVFVNVELEKYGINRTACLLYKKGLENIIKTTDPVFQSFHSAGLCIGSFGALLFTGCCINELRQKNYRQAAIAATGALVFIAATYVSNQAGPKLLSAHLAYLLTPHCPFDPIESQIL